MLTDTSTIASSLFKEKIKYIDTHGSIGHDIIIKS